MGTKDTSTARWFAIAKHGDQMYGQQPYSYHLDDAVKELFDHVLYLPALKFYDHNIIICATYLHDVLEDTETTADELRKLFDDRIVELVQAVTDGEGKNRKERKANTYIAIRATGVPALAVKLADRLSNAKTSGLAKGVSDMLKMYRKEEIDFELGLCAEVVPWFEPLKSKGGFLPVFQKIREYLGMMPWYQVLELAP
jgi:(p)ppGpp synthase/HD superfamily hydrolase